MNLPNKALTDNDLNNYVKKLQVPFFRGIFMRDDLPNKVKMYESGILNHDSSSGPGTHWTAYKKDRHTVIYFDSFGNLRPPKELVSYLNSSGPCVIHYNYANVQPFNAVTCGHLVLQFLKTKSPFIGF